MLRSNDFELIIVLTVRKFFDESLNCLFLDILPVNLTIESVIKTLLQPGNVWKVLSGTQLGFLDGVAREREIDYTTDIQHTACKNSCRMVYLSFIFFSCNVCRRCSRVILER